MKRPRGKKPYELQAIFSFIQNRYITSGIKEFFFSFSLRKVVFSKMTYTEKIKALKECPLMTLLANIQIKIGVFHKSVTNFLC